MLQACGAIRQLCDMLNIVQQMQIDELNREIESLSNIAELLLPLSQSTQTIVDNRMAHGLWS